MDKRIWLALAAFLGIGALSIRKAKAFGAPMLASNPKTILSIYAPSKLPPTWPDAFDSFDVISMRLLGPQITSDSTAYYDVAKNLGKGIHGWGYQFCDSIEQADREIERLKIQIAKYGIEMYWVNAETQWWNSPNPVAYMNHFVQRFRSEFPGVGLAWNGYTGASKYGDAFIQMFDIWGPMTYGTCPDTISGKIRKLAATGESAGVTYCPTVRVGEKKKDTGNCTHWGYAFGPDGLTTLNAELRFPWINFWHGALGAKSTLVTGNDKNPSLVDLVPMLKAHEVA